MKHRVSLILSAILVFGGIVMALFPMARYVGACVAAVGVLVFLFPRVPVWLRWVLGVLTALALSFLVGAGIIATKSEALKRGGSEP